MSVRESDDTYCWVCLPITDRYRVSVAADGSQYIIQYRRGRKDSWEGKKYFPDLKGVVRGLQDLELPIDSWLGHVAKRAGQG